MCQRKLAVRNRILATKLRATFSNEMHAYNSPYFHYILCMHGSKDALESKMGHFIQMFEYVMIWQCGASNAEVINHRIPSNFV